MNGKPIGYATRFGSNDTVGCGITKSGDIYFTINGMMLPLINIEMQGYIYPIVSMRGKYTSVSVEIGPDFLFKHSEITSMSQKFLREP